MSGFGERTLQALVDKLLEERRERTEQEQDHLDRPRTAQGAFMGALVRVVDELPLGGIGSARELVRWAMEDQALLCEVQGEIGDEARDAARRLCAALTKRLREAQRLDTTTGEMVPVAVADVVA